MIQNRTPINFLKHVFGEDVASVANILVAEAEDNYDHIIAALTAVGNKVQEWIGQLQKERDEKLKEDEK